MEEIKEPLWKKALPYVIILLVVILIRSFIVTPIVVDGPSMESTLQDGEMMLLWKLGDIKRYDIVVIDVPNDHWIKRVIALPGEKIKCVDHIVYVNDEAIKEEYTKGLTGDFEEVTLKDGEFFVMGDNRENSTDSRMIGSITIDQIRGKTNFVLFPFNKFGKVK